MSSAKPLPIALTMGDPAGCGPSITVQAWQQWQQSSHRPLYVIGQRALYAAQVETLLIKTPSEVCEAPSGHLPVLEPDGFDLPTLQPGQPSATSAPAIIQSIEVAVLNARAGQAAAIVTNPINKALLYDAGFNHPGHTEFIAELSAQPGEPPPQPVMMLVGGGLRVALATIHMPLRDVPSALSTDALVKLGQTVCNACTSDFGIASPRIVFTGLNPHAGEDGAIGNEEKSTINPAAAKLREWGYDVADARPADTVFAEALAGAFDAVIAMTHDQGLIPVKTLDFWGGVNVTLGLPIVRTSPDHGTAYDAAAAGTARPDSLLAAIRLADEIASMRAGT